MPTEPVPATAAAAPGAAAAPARGSGEYASALLSLPGAVPGDGADAGVAAHYGDPAGEQRRLSRGEAYVDLSHFGVVRVTGPDRLPWLHSLVTQHVERLRPGDRTEALVLSPHGHVEHHLRIEDDGASTWAVVEPGTAPALVAFLDGMRFMLRVEVADESAGWAVRWSPDRGYERIPRESPVSAPEPDADTGASPGGPEGAETRDASGPGEGAGTGRDEPGAAPGGRTWAGMLAYEALRIERREPRLGLDTDHRTIPHEVGWLDSAVHLDKGCYRGQETVARVHTLGRPPRRLVFLHLDGSVDTLPPHGAPIEWEGRRVGTVGSSARHYELGPVALAVIKRSVPVDSPLLAGGVAASAEVVVPPDAGLHVEIRVQSDRSRRTFG